MDALPHLQGKFWFLKRKLNEEFLAMDIPHPVKTLYEVARLKWQVGKAHG